MRWLGALFFLSIGIFFCTPPSPRIRPSKEGPYFYPKKDFSKKKSWVRVKLHQGTSLPIEAPQWVFQTKEGKKLGKGRFLPFTEGIFASSDGKFYFKGKKYPGQLKIHHKNGQYLYVNYVDLDNYLVSVVSHEMNPQWPLDALKAQAVVARTYLYQRLKENQDKLYDVESSTNHQVYMGSVEKAEKVWEAVHSTQDQVLLYRGNLAQVFFHSSCGGTTASASEVWGRDFPYLIVQKSLYCSPAPVYEWQAIFSLTEIKKRLRMPTLKKLEIAERTASKRVKAIRLYSKKGMQEITGEEFRRLIGVTEIKSTFFAIKTHGKKLIIRGRGYGHGVGLCQWGARFMVENHRMDYRSILQHYFPGTNLAKSQELIIS